MSNRPVVGKYSCTLAMVGLAVVGWLPSMACAQADVIVQVSTDSGQTWGDTMMTTPGTRVRFRVRIRDQSPFLPHLGLARITYQTTLTNFTLNGDSVDPFSQSTGVGPSGFGRINPFAAFPMSGTEGAGPLTAFLDNGSTLRFAGQRAANPALIDFGVQTGQVPLAQSGTTFNTDSDVVVFQFGVFIGDMAPRTLVATVPLESILNQQVRYYTDANGATETRQITAAGIQSARLIVIPAPGGLALLGGVCGLALRRRRR